MHPVWAHGPYWGTFASGIPDRRAHERTFVAGGFHFRETNGHENEKSKITPSAPSDADACSTGLAVAKAAQG